MRENQNMFKVFENILYKVMFIVGLACQKVFLENQDFSFLSSTFYSIMTISKIRKLIASLLKIHQFYCYI